MSHRFLRCPHCKMPHDATERVCPNTGLVLVNDNRPAREAARAEVRRSLMSELPPPEHNQDSFAVFNPLAAPAREPGRESRPRREPERGAVKPKTEPRREARPSSAASASREAKHELLGQTVGNRYRIRGVLGEGGMGTVYDAEHLGLSRQVAIKVLSPAQAKKRVAVKRFQQEARAAGAIGHPNICEVYDLGLLDDGSPYLVMEKLIGQTLAERIAKEGGLPFDDVVEVIIQVLSGLIAAHEKGIVHRDIKPENIFLARRVGCPAIIKLLDFGVSKMMPEFQTSEDALDLTRTGMVMGTPYYMSPEQARGERNLDGRVDVYACGVVMYEAIVGKRPFLAPNYNALLLAIINTMPKPIREARPGVPPELEAIIARAMAKNRADRYASAAQFLRDLAPMPIPVPAADGSGRLPAPPSPEERKRAPVLGGGRAPAPERDRESSASRGGRRPPAAGAELAPPSSVHRDAAGHALGPLEATAAGARARLLRASQVPAAEGSARPGGVLDPAAFDATIRGTRPPGLIPVRRPAAGASPSETEGVPESSADEPPESEDSFDIPIHVTEPELEIPAAEDLDEPTEVFHSRKHKNPTPLFPPRHDSSASVLPDRPSSPRGPSPTPTEVERGRPAHYPAPPASDPSARANATIPTANPIESSVEDWDQETMVKRPDMTPSSVPALPQAGDFDRDRTLLVHDTSRRAPRPFNPDETMKLDRSTDVDLADKRPRRR